MEKRFFVIWIVSGLLTLGFFLLSCGDNQKECSVSADCVKIKGENFYCDPLDGTCKCTPSCFGKCGGSDGCGKTCVNNCDDGEICNETTYICELPVECSVGQVRCSGDVIQKCIEGKWTNDEDCSKNNEVCLDGKCDGGGACEPGDTRCNGNTVQTCNTDKTWTDVVDCSAGGQVCRYGRCESGNSCDNVTCSGHGTCTLIDSEASCICDSGYEAQGLSCVPSGSCLLLGVQCTDSSECCESWCLKYAGEDKGYCTKRDCLGDDTCVNHGTDSAQMCCVEVAEDYSICMKIAEGYACGDGSGMCGSSCAGQMDSACDSSQTCLSTGLDDPNAFCAHQCMTNNDCADCSDPNDVTSRYSCQTISGGATYCMVNRTGLCDSSLDCQDQDVCVAWPSDDQQSMEGKCADLGDLPPGSECDSGANPNDLPAEQRCSDFYCLNGHCSEVCTMDNDCMESMVCSMINFRMNDNGATASIGMCLWIEGSGDVCSANTDCSNDEICKYYLSPNHSVNKVCATRHCDPQGAQCSGVGEPCGAGKPECFTGICLVSDQHPDAWCSALCDDDNDCPPAMECGLLGVSDSEITGACVPR